MLKNKIKYDPKIRHRRSIRLKGYDYSQAGAYFITICVRDSECLFGEIVNDEMILNEYGKIANDEWGKLPQRFPNFELDVFQIMPNHMHGIIVLNDYAGATLADAHHDGAGVNPAPTKTIGDMVGAYKSLVANECLKIFKLNWETGMGIGISGAGGNEGQRTGANEGERAGASPAHTMGKLWQRNYYEHIIRNEQSYQTISNYIIHNPANWVSDKFFNKRPVSR
jgi:putative transposase